MINLSLPWTLGPVPIGLTVWASCSIYRAIATRDGITWASAVSTLGLVAFVAALTAHLARPDIDQIVVVLIAQILGTAACIALGTLLWYVQKTKADISLRRPQSGQIVRGIALFLSVPIVADGLFYLFPNAGKCDHFTAYSAGKCAGQEFFVGIHDVPVMVYFGVLLVTPAPTGLSIFVVALFKPVGGPDKEQAGPSASG